MNKSDLLEGIAKSAELTKADAGRALNAFVDQVSRALKKGDKVAIAGFGTFLVRRRAARGGHNPRTGEVLRIKARKVPVFKAGAALKAAV